MLCLVGVILERIKKKLKIGEKMGRKGVWLEGKEERKLVEFGCFSLWAH